MFCLNGGGGDGVITGQIISGHSQIVSKSMCFHIERIRITCPARVLFVNAMFFRAVLCADNVYIICAGNRM